MAHGFESDPITVWGRGHRRHGPVFRMPVDGVETIMIGTPAGLEELFEAERQCLRVLNTALIHDLFGRALFNLSGSDHSHARRLLRNALSRRALAGYGPALLQVTAPTTARWARLGVADIYREVRDLTGVMSVRVLLDVAPGEPDASAFTSEFDRFVTATGAPAGRARFATGRYWAGRAARKRLHSLFDRRAAAVDRGQPGASVFAALVGAFADAATEWALTDHLLGLLIAARDTTASLITWSLVELAGDLESARLAAAEACSVSAQPALLMRLDALPVMRSVLCEIQRLHSPNLLAVRETLCPMTLGGYRIDTGTRVAYSTSAGHFDPDVFAEPHAFRADRFLAVPRRRHQLWAFGGGAHTCLGQSLAELMALVVMTSVLQRGLPRLPEGPPTRIRYRPGKVPVDQRLVLDRHEPAT
jgi:cytochrome P450